MQIPTTLLLENSEIIKGLFTGELVRYGSVIRRAIGTEGAGQIVKHLAESPGITTQIITKGIEIAAVPLSAIPAIADLVVNTVGHGKTHNQLTGITESLSQNAIDHAKTHNQLLETIYKVEVKSAKANRRSIKQHITEYIRASLTSGSFS